MKNIQHPENNGRKLNPWLHIVRNGSRVVNAVRSDGSTRVACAVSIEAAGVRKAPISALLVQQAFDVPRLSEQVQPSPAKLPKRLKLPELEAASNAFVNVFIEFFPKQKGDALGQGIEMERVRKKLEDNRPPSEVEIPCATVSRRNFLCTPLPITVLDELDQGPAITYVHPSEPLILDHPEVTNVSTKKVPSKAIGSAKKYGRGEGVLIGFIDVGGFDFSHLD